MIDDFYVKNEIYLLNSSIDGRTDQRLTGTWVQAKGVKGGITTSWETAVDAGMQRGAQVQMEEDGRWRVRAMPRWAAIFTGRGGGERVKNRGL